jgi:integrase
MLTWLDFNFENRTVNVTPEKGSEPRQLKISNQFIAMMTNLPKDKSKPYAISVKLNCQKTEIESAG